MNPFRKNKNKIDSKIPKYQIDDKIPDDELNALDFANEEDLFPQKVNVDDFNPPPKKNKIKDLEKTDEKKIPSDLGKSNEKSNKHSSRGVPDELRSDKKEKSSVIPSSLGTSDSKGKC